MSEKDTINHSLDTFPFGPNPLETSLSEIEKTPLKDRKIPNNIYDLIKCIAEQYGTNTAIKCLPKGLSSDTPIEMSYQEIFEKITRTANLFDDLGVKGDDVVAFMLPNLMETFCVYLAAETAGIALPVNPNLDPQAIISILNNTNAKVLVIYGAHPELKIWPLLIGIKQHLKTVKHIVMVESDYPANMENVNFEVIEYAKAIAQQPKDELKSQRVFTGNEIAAYCMTSGTTVRPKFVKRTHANQTFSIWLRTISFPEMPDGSNLAVGFSLLDRDLVLLSMLAALAGQYKPLIIGLTGYYNPDTIHHFWNIVKKHNVSVFLTAPALIPIFLNSASLEDADLSSLKYVIYGGESLKKSVYEQFTQRTGLKLTQFYNLTETTFAGTLNNLSETSELSCIGQREAYTEMKIAEIDDNGNYVKDCETNTVGTICMRGPHVCAGYLGMQDNSSLADDWFNTGDMGRLDEEGNFWFLGRSKYQFKSDGQLIEPVWIENILEKSPHVAAAFAIGMPHSMKGNLPVAYVKLKPGIDIDVQELKSFYQQNMDEHQISLANIFILDQIPQTQAGKIDRQSLIRDALKRNLENELSKVREMGCDLLIAVEPDPLHLTQVKIKILNKDQSILDKANEMAASILAAFTFKYTISLANAA